MSFLTRLALGSYVASYLYIYTVANPQLHVAVSINAPRGTSAESSTVLY